MKKLRLLLIFIFVLTIFLLIFIIKEKNELYCDLNRSVTAERQMYFKMFHDLGLNTIDKKYNSDFLNPLLSKEKYNKCK